MEQETLGQTSLLTFLDSDSPEWSESLIVLGRGIDTWSRRYRTRAHCIICTGEVSGLLRLYPLFAHERAEKFDVVHVVIRDEHPERHRPESRKIYPNSTRVTGQKGDETEKQNILKSLCEPGEVLHGEGWKRKTIQVIEPINPHLWTTKALKLMVRYKCSIPNCKGHLNEVLEVVKVDKVGRRWRREEEIDSYISKVKWTKVYFVMGTHRNHPHRWILVTIHSF